MAKIQLSMGTVDGTSLGASTTDLISLYNVTGVAQAATITSVATTAVVTACGVFGFSSAAQASGLVVALNSVLLALKNLGVTA